MKIRTVIIIVTWNRLDLLQPLFDSLKKQTHSDFGVVIVDNGSNDGSVAYLKKISEKSQDENVPVWTLLLKENSGFAVANNLAMSFALRFDPEYFILLNNDTVPNENFIEILFNKANSYSKKTSLDPKLFPFLSENNWRVGSLAPLIENYYSKNKIDSAGIRIFSDGSAINNGVGEDKSKFNQENEVFGPSGASVLYSRKALDEISPLGKLFANIKQGENTRIINVKLTNESYEEKSKSILNLKEYFCSRYFAYYEDVDLAWRLRLNNYGCVLIPSAQLLHHHSATGKSYSPFKSFYVHRNQYFNITRSFPSYYLLLGILRSIRRYFYLLKSIKKKKGPAAALKKNSSLANVFSITLKGWLSFLKNLPGLLAERNIIQSKRKINTKDFQRILCHPKFRASFSKMIFETPQISMEQSSSGVEDKNRRAQEA